MNTNNGDFMNKDNELLVKDINYSLRRSIICIKELLNSSRNEYVSDMLKFFYKKYLKMMKISRIFLLENNIKPTSINKIKYNLCRLKLCLKKYLCYFFKVKNKGYIDEITLNMKRVMLSNGKYKYCTPKNKELASSYFSLEYSLIKFLEKV